MRRLHGRIKESRTGSALVGVLCVMCIFAAIALSMLFASYQVLHHSQQVMTKEQCHVFAETFSRELDGEITSSGGAEAGGSSASIRGYIQTCMTGETWNYFDEKVAGHGKKDPGVVKTIHTEIPDSSQREIFEKKAGNLEISLYWRRAGGSEDYKDRILTVEVTASLRGEQYRISNEYRLMPDSAEAGEKWIWYNIDSNRSGGGGR